MKESEILFLDEPTSGLDLKNQNEILKTINSLDKSVVFSTHSLNHALFCAQKVLILYKDLSYKFGSYDEN